MYVSFIRTLIKSGLQDLRKVITGGDTYMDRGLEEVRINLTMCFSKKCALFIKLTLETIVFTRRMIRSRN